MEFASWKCAPQCRGDKVTILNKSSPFIWQTAQKTHSQQKWLRISHIAISGFRQGIDDRLGNPLRQSFFFSKVDLSHWRPINLFETMLFIAPLNDLDRLERQIPAAQFSCFFLLPPTIAYLVNKCNKSVMIDLFDNKPRKRSQCASDFPAISEASGLTEPNAECQLS